MSVVKLFILLKLAIVSTEISVTTWTQDKHTKSNIVFYMCECIDVTTLHMNMLRAICVLANEHTAIRMFLHLLL